MPAEGGLTHAESVGERTGAKGGAGHAKIESGKK
jgi:hypothetical protein